MHTSRLPLRKIASRRRSRNSHFRLIFKKIRNSFDPLHGPTWPGRDCPRPGQARDPARPETSRPGPVGLGLHMVGLRQVGSPFKALATFARNERIFEIPRVAHFLAYTSCLSANCRSWRNRSPLLRCHHILHSFYAANNVRCEDSKRENEAFTKAAGLRIRCAGKLSFAVILNVFLQ